MAAAYRLVADQKKPCASFLKLTLFGAFADSSHSRRSFVDRGAVGLGIVAAMNASEGEGGAFARSPEALSRTCPIHIGSWLWKPAGRKEDAMETDAELSESYTCVIAHLGGNKVRKKVYYGNCSVLVGDEEEEVEEELFGTPSTPPELEAMVQEKMAEPAFEAADFLRCCALCTKELDGLDIYVYKGEKAFCSEECRYRHILLEEKLGSGALKTGSAGALKTECSSSPSSGSFFSGAGMATA